MAGVEIHGGWRVVERSSKASGPLATACCGRKPEELQAPALILGSLDHELVTCKGDPLLRELMEAMRARTHRSVRPLLLNSRGEFAPIIVPSPDPRIGVRLLALHIPALQWWEHDGRLFYTTGYWITLEGGALDIGIIRDFALGFGDRWRPWKRHLHRLGPRVWRLFGWRPLAPALDIDLVRDSTLEGRNNYELFAEEFHAVPYVGMLSMLSLRDQPIDMSAGNS